MHSIMNALAVALILLANCSFAGESQTPPESQTKGERLAVDLTIYNMNLALIREERLLTLAAGTSQLIIPDIPATIDGTSLHFLSLTDPAAVRVLEQNYQYDLVHQAKLLEKYIGKTVQFVRWSEAEKKEFTVNGRLLSTGYYIQPQASYSPYGQYTGVQMNYFSSGGMIAEIDGKIEINPAGRLLLPELPEGLILKPQLKWLMENKRAGEHRGEISYLAGQLTWSSDYVALISNNDKSLDLTGWVTITNNSGTSFHNAGLKLVAGDVNLVRPDQLYNYGYKAARAADESSLQPQFQQTNLFEFKLYTLQRRTDVMNNETKQVELVSATRIPTKKVFIYDGVADQWRSWISNYSYRDQSSLGQQSNTKVGVFVKFRNAENSGLGIPLPKGKVRVYKRDDQGKEQFIGEDQIDHTPKDEEVKLYLGNAFDLVGERAQKNFVTVVSGHIYDETFQVKVRNHKDEDVDVEVYEHPWRWSQWEITKNSDVWEKDDQTTVKFPVKIPKNSEKVITYTIRYTW
ncbi:MAG TPA: hypothetical protein VIH68_00785 [Bacteroidota bacterium]